VLELKGVVAGYGGGDVLQGVDLLVEQGSITCIVGPNGAGKSTVLRTISGLLRPRSGSIEFEGRQIAGLTCDAVLASGIVQVPQQHALFPQMTVHENILMGGYTIRRDRDLLRERYRAVEEIIPLIKQRMNDKAGNLSGGQRRLLEIGRTLMLDPKVILLDEPSLGLDPRSLKSVTDLVTAANTAGKTILLVEQNVRLGLKIATHGVIMESGRVRMRGDPDGLLGNPQMAALYLGGTMADAHDAATGNSADA
jgi:ABC-type branched-subunit amino acid transport system ATPase component